MDEYYDEYDKDLDDYVYDSEDPEDENESAPEHTNAYPTP